MLSVHSLSRFIGSRVILDSVSFSIADGGLVALIGPSGGGKSTLLKIISGVAHADGGSIDNQTCSAEEVGLMFQEGALFDSLSVLDNVAFPLVRGHVPIFTLPLGHRRAVHERACAILKRVGLISAAKKMPGELSGGMRRRVSLARALVAQPKIVLLDDPTAGLDPVASSVIMELITEIHAEYKPTMIIAGHDLRRLLPVSEKVLALFHGAIHFYGPLKELLHSDDSELLRFVHARFDRDGADPSSSTTLQV